MTKQLSTYPLRLPASLKAAVAEISKTDGTSINQFVTTAVAEKVSAIGRMVPEVGIEPTRGVNLTGF